MEGCEDMLLEFYVCTKEFLTYKCQSSKDWKLDLGGGNFNPKEEINRWLRFEKMRVTTVVGTYKPCSHQFPLHLDGFVLIHTRVWWASG